MNALYNGHMNKAVSKLASKSKFYIYFVRKYYNKEVSSNYEEVECCINIFNHVYILTIKFLSKS